MTTEFWIELYSGFQIKYKGRTLIVLRLMMGPHQNKDSSKRFENQPEPLNLAESIDDPLSEDLSYSSSSDSFPSSSVRIILGLLKTGLRT